MKLMHIAGGGDKGGAKTHILALCSRLKETGDLTLVSLRDGGIIKLYNDAPPIED